MKRELQEQIAMFAFDMTAECYKEKIEEMNKFGGRMLQIDYAIQWAEEFCKIHKKTKWAEDADWYDESEKFLDEKINSL